jgi:hydrogenase/urease accessory protein HupE
MKRILIAALLTPSAALAHPGDHRADGVLHFLSEPDHLALIALGAAVLGYVIYRWSRS